ncbi:MULTISPECIES: 16S rRNA (cytosine(967)-C(5))-methyltransferase RsmB [Pontibacillus]|uniref:16S rRNA (cytosine(967)-C(5))-methyltransferase n=1 Tax=Pontibacillus chungwhensis TaxID=265426 RepID=A0ABY8V2J5_9BACI|nr:MULTISPECIES: 16S rRNA (cytosine(967)-C(5))-methyltransferase RsmB [Pontibacillus]MCD5322633.1 16S rRNA (cytosine(967)-C(5))-methyltransferase RsmB [Pontibacillus sp. HN14]WIG00173.1 16S rRNA (cytosine(967)-C(5))-methyltransferase RsmB [Pontibacillus chungwhensis]
MSEMALRNAALDIVSRVGENGGYSHLLIHQTIEKRGLSDRDTSLLTEIVYGTIQRKDTLDYYITPFVKNKKKLKPWVLWLLYMSCYQMVYLERVPDHAIIHEAVEIAKKRGHKGIVSMVNGVLRNLQRKGVPSLDQIDDPIERVAIETSHPKWMVKRWSDMYGLEETAKMCRQNLERPTMSVRVNTTRFSRDQVMETLKEDGFDCEESILSPQGIIIFSGNILHHSIFKEGGVTVQDESSMLVAEMMNLEEGMHVLDSCSAPGGKSTHIAEKMNNTGQVASFDLHKKKVKLVAEKANQLGLTNISTAQADARHLPELIGAESFDRVLLDAPCSGLGVVRGKPDIKYSKTEDDIDSLSAIQKELLESVSALMKKHGTLVYSTCTVDRQENEEVIQSFLSRHPDFEVDKAFFNELPEECKDLPGISEWGLQLFPQDFDTDGFFLTRLKRKQ